MSETDNSSENICEDGVIENISDNTIETGSVRSDYSDSDNVFVNAYNIDEYDEMNENKQFSDQEQNDEHVDRFNNINIIDNKSDSDSSNSSQNSKKKINCCARMY